MPTPQGCGDAVGQLSRLAEFLRISAQSWMQPRHQLIPRFFIVKFLRVYARALESYRLYTWRPYVDVPTLLCLSRNLELTDSARLAGQ